nr:hypothetical protein [Tanacetum cinerariifolium]GEW88014.1 hypothetical protein [Tanacetum cinerariifolium]
MTKSYCPLKQPEVIFVFSPSNKRNVWGHFGDVRPERLRPGDIKLLLVAFDSQLKVFHPLKNDNASGKHPQCDVQVEKVISFQIGEIFLNQETNHVFNIMQIKYWEVSFYELVKLLIFSSNNNLIQIFVVILLYNFDMGYCNDSFSEEYIMFERLHVWRRISWSPVSCHPEQCA